MEKLDLTDKENFTKILNYLRNKGFARKDKEIVDKTGYDKSTVSGYLNFNKPLSNKFVNKVLEVYNVDLDDVFPTKTVHEITISGMTTEQMKAEIARLKTDVELLKQLFIKNNAG